MRSLDIASMNGNLPMAKYITDKGKRQVLMAQGKVSASDFAG